MSVQADAERLDSLRASVDVPENMSLPPSSSIERFMLEEHLRAVIAENSSDRKLTAAAMSDLPVKNKALALSYVQIELVFSELLRLPKPAQSELFYCVLLIELCKLQPNAMPQVVRLCSLHTLVYIAPVHNWAV